MFIKTLKVFVLSFCLVFSIVSLLTLTAKSDEKEKKVIFPKGMLLKCPINNKPVYKIVEPIREGDGITYKNLFIYGTEKHPEADSVPLCSSIIQSFRGICAFTNNGWWPSECQRVLQLDFKVLPTL